MSGIIKPPTPGGQILAPHVQRIHAEGDELNRKIEAAVRFTTTDLFKGLAPLDGHLLLLQIETMRAYLHILTIRLARANDAANGIIPDAAKGLNKPGQPH